MCLCFQDFISVPQKNPPNICGWVSVSISGAQIFPMAAVGGPETPQRPSLSVWAAAAYAQVPSALFLCLFLLSHQISVRTLFVKFHDHIGKQLLRFKCVVTVKI